MMRNLPCILLCILLSMASGKAMADDVVIWEEDWTGYSKASIDKTFTRDDGITYSFGKKPTIYTNAALAGGTAPELLIQENDKMTVTIPDLKGCSGVFTLSFKRSKDATQYPLTVTSPTTGTEIEGPAISGKTNVYRISVPEGTPQLVLAFATGTAQDANVRIDDILLTAPGIQLPSPTITPPVSFLTVGDQVTITCNGATRIMYQIAGGTGEAVDTEYTGPIDITEDMANKDITIKATATDGTATTTASASYSILPSTLPDMELEGTLQTTAHENTSLIAEHDGQFVRATLKRDMTGDGGWYTLTLPFSITQEQIRSVFGEKAVFQQFVSATTQAGSNKVSLNFEILTGPTTAGVPYLVKPEKGHSAENPVFEGVRVRSGTESNTVSVQLDGTGDTYSFTGSYDSAVLAQNMRFLGGTTGNELLRPSADSAPLKGLRAYFVYPSSSSDAKMELGEESTGICMPTEEPGPADRSIHDLQGRFLGTDDSALQPGIYIIGRKKILKK